MAVVVWSWDASSCVPAPHNHSHHYQCRTPYAAVHTIVLLMMGIMMPETCWDKSLIINIRLVAPCWFLSLHPTCMMHGHKSLKFATNQVYGCEPLLEFSRNGLLTASRDNTTPDTVCNRLDISANSQRFDSLFNNSGYPSHKNLKHHQNTKCRSFVPLKYHHFST